MTSTAPAKINVFVRGTDSAFHAKWFLDGWHGFDYFGGSWLYEPLCISGKPNTLSVIGVGTDRSLYHKYWDGSAWGNYTNIGGRTTGVPAVSKRGNGTIDIFYIGTDSGLHHKSWDGTTWLPSIQGYNELSSPDRVGFIYSPTSVSRDENSVEVYAVGSDGTLYEAHWNVDSGWVSPSTKVSTEASWRFIGTPKAISHKRGHVDVFGIARNSTLQYISSNRPYDWSGPQALPGIWASNPEVISWGPNRIDVFMLAHDSTTHHISWDGQNWGNWTSLGGICMTAPKAVSWSADRFDVFVTGVNGGLYHRWGTGDGTWFPSGGWEALGGVATSRVG